MTSFLGQQVSKFDLNILKSFSVGVPQFDITGLPGTELKSLCILGRKYSFSRLVAFLKMTIQTVKYFDASLH